MNIVVLVENQLLAAYEENCTGQWLVKGCPYDLIPADYSMTVFKYHWTRYACLACGL